MLSEEKVVQVDEAHRDVTIKEYILEHINIYLLTKKNSMPHIYAHVCAVCSIIPSCPPGVVQNI